MPASIVSLLMFAFLLYCLLDVALTDAPLVRNLPKLVWVLLVVLLPLIGGIAWLLGGRPQHAGVAPGSRTSHGPPPGRNHSTRGNPPRHPRPRPSPPPAIRGPDDDPEFLRRIDERLRRRDDDQ